MPKMNNFLLGNGEKLTTQVPISSGGGPKNPPYTFIEAQGRFKNAIQAISKQVQDLPENACPGGETVLAILMHPRYISKSDFPIKLFDNLGLRSIGSRAKKVSPQKWGIDKHPSEAQTEEIFVAGQRKRILNLERMVDTLTSQSPEARDLIHIEGISFPLPTAKLKYFSDQDLEKQSWLEIVLHNHGQINIFNAFVEYATSIGSIVDINRKKDVGGLTFVPVKANSIVAEQLAHFSFLRVARSMPTLRPFQPRILRDSTRDTVALPGMGPMTTSFRALIFDGGIPANIIPSMAPWVNLIEPPNIGQSMPDFEAHGLAVTSAFLFGPIGDPLNLQQPICGVDHVRVLDEDIEYSNDPYYFDVLERILNYFDNEKENYNFINISIGPNLPTYDEDVTLWTSALDERFSTGNWVVTVAAGNDGERDAEAGLNRIQPPADGVNVLTVGASDSFSSVWGRAAYSCTGPGRSPGVVKPDGVSFGGSLKEPFCVVSPTLQAKGTQGTSFAAPLVLRSAVSIKAQLGESLGALAIRTLLIHRVTEAEGMSVAEIGWGRFESDPEKLITCNDDEALVIYQGELPIGEHLRAQIPLPSDSLQGMINISATLLICTDVDPSHPSTYTRNGLTVSFRPHNEKFTTNKDGISSQHPQTKPFFSANNMYGKAEFALRGDGHKWEPCLRGNKSLQADSLKFPCFDIYNHRRAEGVADPSTRIKYALIVTVTAKKVQDLYGMVLRTYSNILIPLRPRLRIEIPT